MFLSASCDLKFHTFTEHGIESNFLFNSLTKSEIIQVSWCKDNTFIVILQENSKPKIISFDKARIIHTIDIENVTFITFKNNTKRNLAITTKFGETFIYDTKIRSIIKNFPKFPTPIIYMEFTTNDQQICGISEDYLVIYGTTEENLKKIKQKDICTALKCSKTNGNNVVVGCINGYFALWDIITTDEIFNFQLMLTPIRGILVKDDENYLISSGNTLKICSINSRGVCTSSTDINEDVEINSIDLSKDGLTILMGLGDGTVKIYDLFNQKCLFKIKIHETPITKVLFGNISPKLSIPEEEDDTTKKHLKALALESVKTFLTKVIKRECDKLESHLDDIELDFQRKLVTELKSVETAPMHKFDVFINKTLDSRQQSYES